MHNTLAVVSKTSIDEALVSVVFDSDDGSGIPRLRLSEEKSADSADMYSVNQPRLRRALILKALHSRSTADDSITNLALFVPAQPERDIDAYRSVHSENLINFLSNAWKEWCAFEENNNNNNKSSNGLNKEPQPLIPCNMPLPREIHQRPSQNVIGKVGYYCTDLCTPIVALLEEEMRWDAAIVHKAIDESMSNRAAYALTTHPGHHAAHDSFGGYCYINHAAHAAKMLQQKLGHDGDAKVAILDVDYHCGNGTASIFYEDPSVLVVSLHCDPDYEYPFHSGFLDQTGSNGGEGTTLHIPLAPQTSWNNGYKQSLEQALDHIVSFKPRALVVSLGLDTHEGDQVKTPGAGFCLSGEDFKDMGKTMGRKIIRTIPTVFIQEGGYKMDVLGGAAADVVLSFCSE